MSRKRPCILYDLKRCIAPCVANCTKEEYGALVHRVIDFLRGHDTHLLKELYREMEKASETLEFEKANTLLTTIRNIEATLEKQTVEKAGRRDIDVIGLSREASFVAVTQLFFREGKLMGSHDHLFTNNIQEDEELLSSFLLQHYGEQTELPHEIASPFELKEQETLSELLSENQKHKVVIFSPKKGEKKELLAIAQKNAEATLKQEKEEKDVKEKALITMEEELHLTNYPEQIECFDNSNLSGGDPVSVLISYKNGKKEKSGYRKYKITPTLASDDYGALKEVLYRRYSRAKEEDNLPDLLVIDGGKGHLNLAVTVLSSLNISTVDVIALAKEEHKHTKGMTLERVYHPLFAEPFVLKGHSPILFFLQEIRDEAHRFAITFQRNRRSKKTLKSRLDQIPGIGPIKKKRLLSHFGSFKRIQEASDAAILSIKGINKKDLEAIRSH